MSTMLSNLDPAAQGAIVLAAHGDAGGSDQRAVTKQRYKRGEVLVEQGKSPTPWPFC